MDTGWFPIWLPWILLQRAMFVQVVLADTKQVHFFWSVPSVIHELCGNSVFYFWNILYAFIQLYLFISLNKAWSCLAPIFFNLFDNSHSNRCEITTHCGLLIFPWRLEMMKFFSHAFWPFQKYRFGSSKKQALFPCYGLCECMDYKYFLSFCRSSPYPDGSFLCYIGSF